MLLSSLVYAMVLTMSELVTVQVHRTLEDECGGPLEEVEEQVALWELDKIKCAEDIKESGLALTVEGAQKLLNEGKIVLITDNGEGYDSGIVQWLIPKGMKKADVYNEVCASLYTLTSDLVDGGDDKEYYENMIETKTLVAEALDKGFEEDFDE